MQSLSTPQEMFMGTVWARQITVIIARELSFTNGTHISFFEDDNSVLNAMTLDRNGMEFRVEWHDSSAAAQIREMNIIHEFKIMLTNGLGSTNPSNPGNNPGNTPGSNSGNGDNPVANVPGAGGDTGTVENPDTGPVTLGVSIIFVTIFTAGMVYYLAEKKNQKIFTEI